MNPALSKLVVANEGWTEAWGEMDYSTCAPHVCCGWLEMHKLSEQEPGTAPLLWFVPLYWNLDSKCIIASAAGGFEEYAFNDSRPMVYDANVLIGFMPRHVADAILVAQSLDVPEYRSFLTSVQTFEARVRPQAVWDWTDEQGNAVIW